MFIIELAIISLISLLLVIVIGFIKKLNMGILALGASLIIATIFKLDEKIIIEAFSANIFITMAGVSFYFAILTDNKTLSISANKIVYLFGKHKYIVPLVIFIIGAFLSSLGPGPLPLLAVIPVLAVPIAMSTGHNPVMLSIIGQCGAMGARMSPLTPDYAVVHGLLKDFQPASDIKFYLSGILTAFVISLVVFIYYKGWRLDYKSDHELEKTSFEKEHIISLITLLILIIAVIVFHTNVGLTAFAMGSLLGLLNIGDEKEAIKKIPWGVILLVLGVGMLMNIVISSGGVKFMADKLSNSINKQNAGPIVLFFANTISFFASGLGVVFPTLIPMVLEITSSFNDPNFTSELISMVIVGGTFTGLSPFTTAGALVMSAVSTDDRISKDFSQNKLFMELLFLALFIILIEMILSYIGIYSSIFR